MAKPDLSREGRDVVLAWPEHNLRVRVSPEGAAANGRLPASVLMQTCPDADDVPAKHILGPVTVDLLWTAARGQLRQAVQDRVRALKRDHEAASALIEQLFFIAQREFRGGVVAAPVTYTSTELLALELPPVREVVPGILPEGLILLAGPPKIRKSWLCLHLVWCVATGGVVLGQHPDDGRVEQGEALYLALEDRERRLRSRLETLLLGEEGSPALHFRNDWSRLDAGGVEELEAWLDQHPSTRLVVIDTLAKARGQSNGRGRLYDEDYASLEGLQSLAQRRRICIVVVHHTRKSGSVDPLELLSGTTGITGVADGILVLMGKRSSPRATLAVICRDLPGDRELAMVWEDGLTQWVIKGNADDVEVSETRQQITDALFEAQSAGETLSPKELAEMTELAPGAVRAQLFRMVRSGHARKTEHGRYAPGPDAQRTPEKSEISRNSRNTHNTRNTRNSRNTTDNNGHGYGQTVTAVTPVTGVTGVTGVTAVTAVTRKTGIVWDNGTCSDCGGLLTGRTCWTCRARWCAECHQPTGGPLRQYCDACSLRLAPTGGGP